jgi:hypothetical protein
MFEDNKAAAPAPKPVGDPEGTRGEEKAAPKPDSKEAAAPESSEIHTMPMDYYLGDKTKQAAKGAKPAKTKVAQAAPQVKASGGGGDKKMIITIVIIVLAAAILAVGGYFVYARFFTPSYNAPVDVEVPAPIVEEPVADAAPEEPEVDEPVVDAVVDEPVVEEPAFDPNDVRKLSLALLASEDEDQDGLTDEEEKLVGTNPKINDSDKDTYLDGEEVDNYYSPLQKGAVRVDEDSFVATYENKRNGYKLIYPKQWLVGPLDELTQKDVMFTSSFNEFVNVLIETKSAEQSVEDWYLEQAPSVTAVELKKYENYNELAVVESPDAFTVYFGKGTMVYILNYNIGLSEKASYPALFGMMINSFEIFEPEQVESPAVISAPEPASTASIVNCGTDTVCLSQNIEVCTPSAGEFKVLEAVFSVRVTPSGSDCIIRHTAKSGLQEEFSDWVGNYYDCTFSKEELLGGIELYEDQALNAPQDYCTGPYVDLLKEFRGTNNLN